MSSVICIESDDDEVCIVTPEPETVIILDSQKSPSRASDPIEIDEPGPSQSTTVKRVKPTLISAELTSPSKKKDFGANDKSPDKSGGSGGKRKGVDRKKKEGTFKRTRLIKLSDNLDLSDAEINSDEETQTRNQKDDDRMGSADAPRATDSVTNDQFTKEFRKLVATCKGVDSSVDMDKLIRKKLLAYYREVPPDFVISKSFRDLVAGVTGEIKSSPHLIYLKITRIIEELKPRRRLLLVKKEPVDVSQINGNGEEASSGTSVVEQQNLREIAKKDAQIKKLNKALAKLKKRIDELDKEEVNFDEDVNSAHMKVERYKKRACQIYEKICEISGESKHAQRSARKPIKFHGTVYPEFNKTLQAFVNRTNIFPDYFDVKKCLEHCDKLYNMKLRPEEIRMTAQDAFVKVGKILQKRRKIDLFEMVSYFGGTEGDPADEDADLQEKLSRNKQYHSKISDLIDKYADDQGKNGNTLSDDEESDDNDDGSNKKTSNPGSSSRVPDLPQKTEKDDADGPLDESFDLFTGAIDVDDDSGPNSPAVKSEIEIIDPAPPTNGFQLPPPVTLPRETISQLPESVNMDEAIEYMVSNHVDAFEAIPSDVEELLMQGF